MADGRHDDDEYALSDEQKAAVAELSRSNVYAKQSKWKTLHELPMADRKSTRLNSSHSAKSRMPSSA